MRTYIHQAISNGQYNVRDCNSSPMKHIKKFQKVTNCSEYPVTAKSDTVASKSSPRYAMSILILTLLLSTGTARALRRINSAVRSGNEVGQFSGGSQAFNVASTTPLIHYGASEPFSLTPQVTVSNRKVDHRTLNVPLANSHKKTIQKYILLESDSGVCPSIDSKKLTIHPKTSEVCSKKDKKDAINSGLIKKVYVDEERSQNAIRFTVLPGEGNYRTEVSYGDTPELPARSKYTIDIRFDAVSQKFIFLQVKDCGGEIKGKYKKGCYRPSAALSVSRELHVYLSINKLALSGNGEIKEFTKKFKLTELNAGKKTTDERTFNRFEVFVNRAGASPNVDVFLNGTHIGSYTGELGAEGSTHTYVKGGIYASNAIKDELNEECKVTIIDFAQEHWKMQQ